MQLLLCAATEQEIRPTMDFIKANGIGHVEILITGVGLTAATYALTRNIYTKRPGFILQAGIAGNLDEQLPLTKTVIVENEFIGDLGVTEKGTFKTVFDMNFLQPSAFPWKNGKLPNDLGALKQTGLTIVDGVTVNEISTQPEKMRYYRSQGAQVESMEGAALHYVALMEKIPFLQIRTLSNFAGERDKEKWVTDMAIANLNLEIQRILSKF